MAKRELSSTLKNLKFMQRAVLKEEKSKEEDDDKLKGDGAFGSSATLKRKCTVVMEGNPHPGAIKGRMSFQNFNPSIDKLNQEAENSHRLHSHISSMENQNGQTLVRENGISTEGSDANHLRPDNCTEVDSKRKQPEAECEIANSSHNSQRYLLHEEGDDGQSSSSQNNRKGSYKQQKREKLDWNVLRPPKGLTKKA